MCHHPMRTIGPLAWTIGHATNAGIWILGVGMVNDFLRLSENNTTWLGGSRRTLFRSVCHYSGSNRRIVLRYFLFIP